MAIATVLVTVWLAKALEPAHETVSLTFRAWAQPRGRAKPDEKRRLRAVTVRLAVAEPQAADTASLPVKPETVMPAIATPCLCEAAAFVSLSLGDGGGGVPTVTGVLAAPSTSPELGPSTQVHTGRTRSPA